MTTAALDPAQALALLAALHTDLKATAVLDADGGLLAGDPELVEGPVGLRASHAETPSVVARSATHTVVARPGPSVLPGVLAIDLETVLEALTVRA